MIKCINVCPTYILKNVTEKSKRNTLVYPFQAEIKSILKDVLLFSRFYTAYPCASGKNNLFNITSSCFHLYTPFPQYICTNHPIQKLKQSCSQFHRERVGNIVRTLMQLCFVFMLSVHKNIFVSIQREQQKVLLSTKTNILIFAFSSTNSNSGVLLDTQFLVRVESPSPLALMEFYCCSSTAETVKDRYFIKVDR